MSGNAPGNAKKTQNAAFWREKSGGLSSLLPFQRDFSKIPIFLSRFELDPFGGMGIGSPASGCHQHRAGDSKGTQSPIGTHRFCCPPHLSLAPPLPPGSKCSLSEIKPWGAIPSLERKPSLTGHLAELVLKDGHV